MAAAARRAAAAPRREPSRRGRSGVTPAGGGARLNKFIAARHCHGRARAPMLRSPRRDAGHARHRQLPRTAEFRAVRGISTRAGDRFRLTLRAMIGKAAVVHAAARVEEETDEPRSGRRCVAREFLLRAHPAPRPGLRGGPRVFNAMLEQRPGLVARRPGSAVVVAALGSPVRTAWWSRSGPAATARPGSGPARAGSDRPGRPEGRRGRPGGEDGARGRRCAVGGARRGHAAARAAHAGGRVTTTGIGGFTTAAATAGPRRSTDSPATT